MKKAKIKADEVISHIKKSFDKVIVWKAVWKLMMVPGFLFGKAVVMIAKTTIDKLQRIETEYGGTCWKWGDTPQQSR